MRDTAHLWLTSTDTSQTDPRRTPPRTPMADNTTHARRTQIDRRCRLVGGRDGGQ